MKKGQVIVHPERWKSAQVVSMALVAIVVPLYSAFCDTPASCFGLGLDDAKNIAVWLGGAIFALFQIWSTMATTDKIGIGRRSDSSHPSDDAGLREPRRQTTSERMSSSSFRDKTEYSEENPDRRSTFDKDVYGSFKSD